MLEFFSRRRFLKAAATASVITQVSLRPALGDNKLPPDLDALIDPLLKLPPPLPAEQNALPLLDAAAKSLSDPPDVWWEPNDPDAPPLDGAQADRIAAWVAENEHVLAQVDEALGLGKAAAPNVDWDADNFNRVHLHHALVRLFVQTALLFSRRKKPADALTTCRILLECCRLFKAARGVYVEYLMAIACENTAHSTISYVARQPDATPDFLRPFLGALADDRDNWRRDLRLTIQGEFQHLVMPCVRKLQNADLPAMIRELTGEWSEGWEAFWSKEAFEGKQRQLEQLFAGHPRPFDAADTVRRLSAEFAGTIRDIDVPWRDIAARPEPPKPPELAAWPAALDLEMADVEEKGPVNEAVLVRARQALAKVDNPIGKQYAEIVRTSPELRRAVHRLEAQRRGTQLYLAALIYEREKGDLPPDLESLVAAKIIDRIPADPLVDRPFGYSKADRKIRRPSFEEQADWAPLETLDVWILPEPEERAR